jgi:hypothetical protein
MVEFTDLNEHPAQRASLVSRGQETLGSNLTPEITYPDHSWLSLVAPGKYSVKLGYDSFNELPFQRMIDQSFQQETTLCQDHWKCQ